VAFERHNLACRSTLAAEQARLAAEHARNAGDEDVRAQALGWYITAMLHGPHDAPTITKELDRIEREGAGPYLAATIDGARGHLAGLAGHFPEARRSLQTGIEKLRAIGLHAKVAIAYQYLAPIELRAGEPARALAALLKADASLAEVAERGGRSTVQAYLAQVYERLGDSDAARAAAELAEELGGEEDVTNFVITHATRARIALADGDGAAAERWARSALQHASRTDDTVEQGNAELELARVLTAHGRREEATPHAHAALELYEAKGDRPGADSARAILDELKHRI